MPDPTLDHEAVRARHSHCESSIKCLYAESTYCDAIQLLDEVERLTEKVRIGDFHEERRVATVTRLREALESVIDAIVEESQAYGPTHSKVLEQARAALAPAEPSERWNERFAEKTTLRLIDALEIEVIRHLREARIVLGEP